MLRREAMHRAEPPGRIIEDNSEDGEHGSALRGPSTMVK